jgi:hypothetical protein
MFLMVPEYLDEKIGSNLEYNQQKLMNHYQIFHSNVKYLGAELSSGIPAKKDIFFEKLPTRLCGDLELMWPEETC